jgi:hypothetical protein
MESGQSIESTKIIRKMESGQSIAWEAVINVIEGFINVWEGAIKCIVHAGNTKAKCTKATGLRLAPSNFRGRRLWVRIAFAYIARSALCTG